MTFYEIYASAVVRLWGDTTPPTSAIAFLQGANGIIANAHRQLQQDYNYWFLRAYTSWPTVAGTQTYGLPAECKEIINLQFKKADEDYFLDPMSVLSLTEPFKTQWINEQTQVEYPTFYELLGESITIYPPPSGIRTVHLIYWSFFDRPVAADWVSGSSTEDSVIEYAGDILSYLSAAEYSLIMKEYDQYQVYNQKAEELIFKLKQENYRRIQAPLQEVVYEEF